jgi:cadmium resistance protein CadD (predicted permease)
VALGGALGVFAGTNVDDLVILTVLFLESRVSNEPKAWQIWAGQYLGIAALVLLSGVAALGLTIVPDEWVGWLGLVPIALGVKSLVGAVRHRDAEDHADDRSPAAANGLLSVVALTVANGADNVSVYTPMFRTLDFAQTLATVAVFAVMPALWCIAASWLGSHKPVIALVERSGHWIVPGIFILIGSLIIAESGVVGRWLLPGASREDERASFPATLLGSHSHWRDERRNLRSAQWRVWKPGRPPVRLWACPPT